MSGIWLESGIDGTIACWGEDIWMKFSSPTSDCVAHMMR